ncbi:MAG TPA: hypothetical protein VGG64_18710 [Pirellulales bacterium]|jgi:hypothetical protein
MLLLSQWFPPNGGQQPMPASRVELPSSLGSGIAITPAHQYSTQVLNVTVEGD